MSIPEHVDALLDTNLLTGYTDIENPRHATVVRFIYQSDLRLYVAPQSLYEFWTAATQPTNVNGLGMPTEAAWNSVVAFRRVFTILPDPPGLLNEWLDLCRAHAVSGKLAHDARLAAYTRLHRIETLVTLNARDFGRYGLRVVVP